MKIILWIIVQTIIITMTPRAIAYEDLMQQAFIPSTSVQQVVNLGNTKMSVGNTVFFGSKGLACSRVEGKFERKPTNNPSLIVHSIKLFLRVTIVLAIPFLLFNAVSLVTAVIGGVVTDYLKYTYRIMIGIAAILTSAGLIWLIQSAVVGSVVGELLRGLLD